MPSRSTGAGGVRSWRSRPLWARAALVVVCAFVAPLASTIASPAEAGAKVPPSVTIRNVGPTDVRVQVAEPVGDTCAAQGHVLASHVVPIGGSFSLSGLPTRQTCVCVSHTIGDAATATWTTPSLACAPQICEGVGRSRTCRPTSDPRILVHVAAMGTT